MGAGVQRWWLDPETRMDREATVWMCQIMARCDRQMVRASSRALVEARSFTMAVIEMWKEIKKHG